jgi:hypothetical protein
MGAIKIGVIVVELSKCLKSWLREIAKRCFKGSIYRPNTPRAANKISNRIPDLLTKVSTKVVSVAAKPGKKR